MTDREIELKIAARLVAEALLAGYMLSVWDSEDWAIKCSTDAAAIVSVMRATDIDTVVLRRVESRERVGSIVLIYGNGIDVISDYSDKPEIENLVDTVTREWA